MVYLLCSQVYGYPLLLIFNLILYFSFSILISYKIYICKFNNFINS